MKALRGQVRQVVKELLPEILTKEVAKEIFDRLQSAQSVQLSAISTNVTAALEKLDQRSKDTLGYLVRSATMVQPPVPTTAPATEGSADDDSKTG
jgi:hypothetical protein